jgi:hypothetical protein
MSRPVPETTPKKASKDKPIYDGDLTVDQCRNIRSLVFALEDDLSHFDWSLTIQGEDYWRTVGMNLYALSQLNFKAWEDKKASSKPKPKRAAKKPTKKVSKKRKAK